MALSPSGVYGTLNVTTPTQSFTHHVKTGSVTVGRSPDGNELVIDDSEVSRWHCRFDFTPSGASAHIVDLNSANGTYVNGEQVVASFGVPLADGTTVALGISTIEFIAPEATKAPKSKPRSAGKQRSAAPVSAKKSAGKVRKARGSAPKSAPKSVVSKIQQIEQARNKRRANARKAAALADDGSCACAWSRG